MLDSQLCLSLLSDTKESSKMDARFISAFTDPAARIKILGRFVSPFSLLNRIQLESASSPFVAEGREVRPLDLLIAVKICAGEPIHRLSLRDYYFLGRMASSEVYFVKQMCRFTEYVMIEAWPKFWEKKSKSTDTTGIPWMLTVVCNLIKNGIGEERAWTMPESQAIWLHSAFAISGGADIKVLTKDDEELIASMKTK